MTYVSIPLLGQMNTLYYLSNKEEGSLYFTQVNNKPIRQEFCTLHHLLCTFQVHFVKYLLDYMPPLEHWWLTIFVILESLSTVLWAFLASFPATWWFCFCWKRPQMLRIVPPGAIRTPIPQQESPVDLHTLETR